MEARTMQKGFSFALTDSNGKTTVCSVDSEEERKVWLSKLRQAASEGMKAEIQTEHEGPVKKQGQLNTAFQMRYFKLAGGNLRYYKMHSNGHMSERGAISCADLIVEEVQQGKESAAFQGILTKEAEELVLQKQLWEAETQGGCLLRIFGVGSKMSGLKGSRLIHPSSPFSVSILFLSVALQIYSSLVSAFFVGFLWQADLCIDPPPTLYFDVAVDAFFLLEIVCNFFTGTYVGERYIDDMHDVARRYCLHGLSIDLVTSFPVSFVEILYLGLVCGDEQVAGSVNSMRLMRASKGLKLARVLKTIKLMARSQLLITVIQSIGDFFRIPPYVLRVQKIVLMSETPLLPLPPLARLPPLQRRSCLPKF